MMFYTVLFEAQTHEGFVIKRETFFPHQRSAILASLKYLSLHSADVDPRMLCINTDLYWTIIMRFGSITKALKIAGGQKLYDIGFGKHEALYTSSQGSEDNKLTCKLITDNFVSKLTNKKTEVRYSCSNTACNKLEDKKKFSSCSGCSKKAKRRYCSSKCQEEDWDEHKVYCQSQEEEVNNNQAEENSAWKQAKEKKKPKGKA